ncbi:MAG: hypothetical protein B6I24_05250 [Bacteroidetes bacterium 4572_128]|nr:MAG: hypothetical protein B6I24_05250 [Bacteroidetes bacterium 4572_128]
MEKKKYNFSEITYKILKKIINIKQVRNRKIFKNWSDFKFEINKYDEEFLLNLIKANEYNIDFYMENQLFGHFINPLLNRVYFYGENYREWFQAEIYGTINGNIFKGKADFLVASGDLEPINPFFFLREFKKQKTDSEPLMQLIAEMVVAIEINKSKKMLGAYNIGRLWYFVILEKISNNKYQFHESESFNSCKIEELKQIYKNLHYIKHKIINNFVKN